MLEAAERVSARILEGVGIQVTWINGPAPERNGYFLPTDLGLRILPQSMADLAPLDDNTLGFAAVSADQRSSYLASVFYQRVVALADSGGFSRTDILGCVMVHELGHLLLGSSGHFPFGIMRARLTPGELLGPLKFTPAQAQLMRADVLARMAAAKIPQ
jgi:hypothetical protein